MDTNTVLAESKNYKIFISYESVYLVDKSNGSEIFVGDFYGDPNGAVIDRQERFSAMYGCGLILYFIREPFENYCYGKNSPQWFEFGRNEPTAWIENVIQIDDDNLELFFENGTSRTIFVCDNYTL
ncbi:MAG: hypothetical protein K2N71_07720 [Oscillospiraceae bacterium]|nr:hypothetical protein [Oscillospiraceae bacterium]